MNFEYYYFIGVLFISLHLLIFQNLNLNISNPSLACPNLKVIIFWGL